jgi:hypothetical protein
LISASQTLEEKTQEYELVFEYLGKRLDQLKVSEMGKIPEEQRLNQYNALFYGMLTPVGLMQRLELSKTWMFYDDEVLKFVGQA